ncbi:kinesin-domain-containing protein, partial [Obba rivulosa]
MFAAAGGGSHSNLEPVHPLTSSQDTSHCFTTLKSTMAGRGKTTTTRASTRVKTAASSVPTATRATRTASKLDTVQSEDTLKKTSTRKPLRSRENSPEARPATVAGSRKPTHLPQKTQVSKAASVVDVLLDMDHEPIKAFLRIRPQLGTGEPSSKPYLDLISNTSVSMNDPQAHSRMSSINPSSIYTFSHVFPSDTQQTEFFTHTTLPLVRDVLEGQNGLLFAYGVTNSGKTYTIQGGNASGSAGILPRTLDVIFNSIEGLHGDGRFRPVRLQGVELASEASDEPISFTDQCASSPALADILDDLSESDGDADTDPTVLKLDRNHEYTIWLSYAEVYNEKVYDLFANVDDPSSTVPASPQHRSGLSRPTSSFLNLPLPSSQSHPLLLTRKALPLKPCPPSDSGTSSADAASAGKYVAGLRQLRVHSAAQAKALLKLGQLHRRVFGTVANSQSSRSHALVAIKVLRVHRGERNDPTSIQTSRLTLVDLAGSERNKHTQTSGDRLREAGNINKSLMVLGQCMETLRVNQRAVARSLAVSGERMDTRDVKKALAIVPFRHSKLTEVLMDYFVGEGRAVMIVNVNPYDTGFDENSHVMKFAALARDVRTNPLVNAPRAVSALPKAKPTPSAARQIEAVPHKRKVTITTGGPGRKVSEAQLEVLEEDEEHDDSRDDEPVDPLVDALFDEIESLRAQLFQAELQCAIVEAETRDEVMQEMEARMHEMEQMFQRRLQREAERHEKKMDDKIDMLRRSGLVGSSRRQPASIADSDHFSQSETSEMEEVTEPEETDDDEDMEIEQDEGIAPVEWSDHSRSPSPLAGRGLKKGKAPTRIASGSTQGRYSTAESWMPEEQTDVTEPSSDEEDSQDPTHGEAPEQSAESKELPSRPSLKDLSPAMPKHVRPPPTAAPSPIFEADVRAGRAQAKPRPLRNASQRLASLEHHLEEMSLEESGRDSTVIVPNKKARKDAVKNGGPDVEYVPLPGEVETVKKKKRVLKRDPVESEPVELGRQLRRSVRGPR